MKNLKTGKLASQVDLIPNTRRKNNVVKLKTLTKKATKSVVEGKNIDELRSVDKSGWSRTDLIKYAEMLQNS
jgi:hypothetical protein